MTWNLYELVAFTGDSSIVTILKYHDKYIYIISEQMTWNLYELVAFIGDSSILKYLDKYNVRQMTWNLHEFVAIADHLSWSLSLSIIL